MRPVMAQSQIFIVLAAMPATDGILDGAKLMLFQNDFTPDRNTLIADLTVATFGGYAPVTLATWGAPFVPPGEQPRIQHASKQFTPNSGVTPNTIYGWGITNTGGTTLLIAVRLDAPVYLIDATTAIIVEPYYSWGG